MSWLHPLRSWSLRQTRGGSKQAPQDGLWLEFGVATGTTIRHLGSLTKQKVYGFDSFEGLPENWRTGFDQGAFAQSLPSVPANVELIKGWYSDTLPAFAARHPERVSLLHVDCDLYSSTKTIFDTIGDRIGPGCVIVFDEYWNYPGWREHEHKAFLEFIAAKELTYRYDSFVPFTQQVCVVMTSAS